MQNMYHTPSGKYDCYLADMDIEEESVSDTEEESPDEDTGEDDQDEMDEE